MRTPGAKEREESRDVANVSVVNGRDSSFFFVVCVSSDDGGR